MMTSTPRIYGPDTGASIGGLISGGTDGSVLFVGTGSVLAQDNANFFWNDTTNALLLGSSTTAGTAYGNLGQKIESNTSANYGGALFATWSTAAGEAPVIMLAKSKSTTVGTQTIVANGDTLGYLLFRGSDGAGFFNAAGIYAQVDGTPGLNDMPGSLVLATTADGSSSYTERMRIDALGRIKFGTAAAYSETGLTSQGVLYYGQTGGILTLAAYSSSGNTQFQLRTAVGTGTNATRFSINSFGAMALTPATSITATTNGSTNLTETASSTHTLIVTRTSTSDANYGIKLTNLGTSGYGSAINWEVYGSSATPNTYSAAQIKVENTGASGGGFLAFLACPAASTTLAEVARLYNDTFLIGRTTGTLSNGILQVRATASASAAEKIARFDVSDDATGKLEILNLSSTDAVFQPGIRATTASTTEGLGIESAITTDTGSAAAMYFQAKTAAGAALTARPLFQWLNFGTVVTSVTATGAWNYTKPSQASTAETLATWSVSDDVVAKIDILNGTSTDSAFNPIIRGTGGSNRLALSIYAAATTDSGGTTCMQFDSRTAAAGAIATRPTFQWTNNNTVQMTMTAGGNLLLGTHTAAGTSAAGVLSLSNGATAPSDSADQVQLFGYDISAGNATLGIRSEIAVATETITPDTTWTVRINGVNYKIPLLAV